MNIRVRRSLMFVLSLLFTLIVALTYRQAFSDDMVSHPGNHRAQIEELSIERGTIYAENGSVLAKNRLSKGIYYRVYPQGAAFAPVTGYSSPSRGRYGLEASQSQWLAARTHFRSFDDWWQSLVEEKRRGFDLKLTVNPHLQKKAWDLLAGHEGSVVALDPRTGAVLAMVSRPSYDPNLIESNWDEIVSTDGMLINRASQGLYPPGSTFKIVMAAAALEERIATLNTKVDCSEEIKVGGKKIRDSHKQGVLTLKEVIQKSSNVGAVKMALKVGPERLYKYIRRFGFGEKTGIDLTGEATGIVKPPERWSGTTIGAISIGHEVMVTPIQVLRAYAAVANGGYLVRPYVV